MNYLIFRTDRIGDFLITSPLIRSIKRNDTRSKIFIVASNKNTEFIKKYDLVDEVFLLKSNKIKDRIDLFLELRKYKFNTIIVSDKKNRSILFGLLLKAQNKIFNVSKNFQKKILNILYKDVFLDNDNLEHKSVKDILLDNSKSLNFDLKDEDFHYLKSDQFKNKFLHNDFLNLDNLDFLLFHYDEKWEIENYSKLFRKASTLTNIDVEQEILMKFLFNLSKKTSKKIIITTGTIDTKIINKLKASSIKINESLYEINFNNTKGYLLKNENFFSLSHLISKSSLFISCHGAFTHIAANYKIRILDIIEKNKTIHYSRITKHMKNYKFLYRDKFLKLSEEIIHYS